MHGLPSEEFVTSLANKHGIKYYTGSAGSVLMFDCNLIHGSHSNISPWGRTNLFVIFNSVENLVGEPFYAPGPRPEHLCTVIFSRFYLLATTGFLSKRQITKRSKWFASIYFKPKQQKSIGSQQLEK